MGNYEVGCHPIPAANIPSFQFYRDQYGTMRTVRGGRRFEIAERSSLSRRPKKRGPFHLVPVIAKATLDRLSKVWPFQANPFAITITRCDCRSHSRTKTVPGLSSVRFWSKLARRADVTGPASFATVRSSTCLVS